MQGSVEMRRIIVGLSVLGILASHGVSASASTELPVVDSAALGTRPRPPWSEPVQINDPFEGDFIGVFDRNFFFGRIFDTRARIEVQSLWSREAIRVLLTTRDRECLGRSFRYRGASSFECSEFNNARNLIELFIRINGEVFQVEGQNNVFPVSNQLAQALQNAPEGNVSIRLVGENGETIDSEIGEDTVEAWRTVYDAAQNSLASE